MNVPWQRGFISAAKRYAFFGKWRLINSFFDAKWEMKLREKIKYFQSNFWGCTHLNIVRIQTHLTLTWRYSTVLYCGVLVVIWTTRSTWCECSTPSGIQDKLQWYSCVSTSYSHRNKFYSSSTPEDEYSEYSGVLQYSFWTSGHYECTDYWNGIGVNPSKKSGLENAEDPAKKISTSE
jgi:hypothetical protein